MIRVEPHDSFAEFERELLAGGMATAALQRRAAGRVRAETVGESSVAVDSAVRDLLECAANEAVAHRSTRLMHGRTLLSTADLWYLPTRLTPDMNHALAVGDVPFGAVIASLHPRRRTLSCVRGDGEEILLVRAVVLSCEGRALALADECYTIAAIRS